MSLPKQSSLCDGSMKDEWIWIALNWMKYLSPTLTIFPDLANSILFLQTLLVLLAVPCTFGIFAMEV